MANILGINLSSLAPDKIRVLLGEWLEGGAQRFIATPNPEIILAAHADEELFYILNCADLAPADGFGLRLAGWLYGERVPRFAGADIVAELIQLAIDKKARIAVLNWRGGLSPAAEIESALGKKYPGLEYLIVDTSRTHSLPSLLEDALSRLATFKPSILFCTFGSPYQEKVIYHNLAKLPSVRIAIGCGGAFDFLTGRLRRAPRVWRRWGLEWLWRLISQPTRWRRIYRAVFVFTFEVLKAMFISRYRYRSNVACLLYKSDAGVKKVLIVERTGEAGHWQLPQGGTDGEEIEIAGARELREETGAVSIASRGVFSGLHRYKFPKKNNYRGSENCEHKYDYRGQKQSLFIAEFLGADTEIKINFWDHSAWRWVEAESLIEALHPIRRSAAQIYIEKFKSLNL